MYCAILRTLTGSLSFLLKYTKTTAFVTVDIKKASFTCGVSVSICLSNTFEMQSLTLVFQPNNLEPVILVTADAYLSLFRVRDWMHTYRVRYPPFLT